MAPAGSRPYDLLVYGASGFTGRLVSLYLAKNAPPSLRWGIAGRNKERLQKVADECKREAKIDVPVVVGHGEVAFQTKAIITTAGPYLLYGEPLLAACVQSGTHYADLTGETLWVHEMIAKYGEQAKKTGAIIVPMSGFDSVPADMGTFFIADQTRQRFAVRLSEVTAYLVGKGSVSGGTIASALNIARQPDSGLSSNPMFLNPLVTPGDVVPGPRVASAGSAATAGAAPESIVAPAADFGLPRWSSLFNTYAWFFTMSSINTRIVRRTATLFHVHSTELASHPATLSPLPSTSAPALAYSAAAPFKYTEWLLSKYFFEAWGGTFVLALFYGLTSIPGGLRFLTWLLPKPGEGPSDKQIARNWFQYFLVGKTEESEPRTVMARVHGRDGGYGDTSMMLAEAGIALALSDASKKTLPAHALGGGFLTPATAFGRVLLQRLQDNANIRFDWIADEACLSRLARTAGGPAPKGQPSAL